MTMSNINLRESSTNYYYGNKKDTNNEQFNKIQHLDVFGIA